MTIPKRIENPSLSDYLEVMTRALFQAGLRWSLNVYYFLFRVGESVPPFEEWVKTIPGDHPRMREMVLG